VLDPDRLLALATMAVECIGECRERAHQPVGELQSHLPSGDAAFRNDGKLVVVESFNSAAGESKASSYRLLSNGTISPISRSVPNGQTDVCWVVITGDGHYAYTANFGTGTISAYRLSGSGELTLLDGRAAFTGELSQPVDLALSADSRFLYLLMRGPGRVAAFRIQNDGSLQPLGTAGGGGLPVNDGASGLAAF
jgi:6-phosphogluconolactonase (cycloisomerase 2 family)